MNLKLRSTSVKYNLVFTSPKIRFMHKKTWKINNVTSNLILKWNRIIGS